MEKTTPYFLLAFATIAWGTLFHVGKDALTYLDPFWFTTIRYFIVSILITIILLITKELNLGKIKVHWLEFLKYGVLGYVIFAIFVFIGLQISTPSHGAVIMATMPITTVFIQWFLTKDTPSYLLLILSVIGLVGVSLVTGVFSQDAEVVTFKGDLIAYVGSIAFIFYSIGQHKFTSKGITVLQFTGYTVIMSLPVLLVVSIIAVLLGFSSIPTFSSLINVTYSMVYVAVVATLLPTLAYNSGIKLLGSVYGILFINLVPISALAISFFKGSDIGTHEILGTLIVISSLILQIFVINKVQIMNFIKLRFQTQNSKG